MPALKGTATLGRYRRGYRSRGCGRYGRRRYRRGRMRMGYSRYRRFPTAGPSKIMVRPEVRFPDQELIRMPFNGVVRRILTSTGYDPGLRCNDLYLQTLNTLLFPTLFGLVYGSAIPATGFAGQNTLYTNWQVRGVKCHVTGRVVQPSSFPAVPIKVVLVPLSGQLANPGAVPASATTYSFNQLAQMQGAKIASFGPTNIYNPEENGMFRLSSFTSPARVSGRPGYYTLPDSFGRDSTPPTDLPAFALGLVHTEPLPNTINIELTVQMTFSVLWFGRKQVPLGYLQEPSIPEPVEQDPDVEEASFDKIPFFRDYEEMKVAEPDPPPVPPIPPLPPFPPQPPHPPHPIVPSPLSAFAPPALTRAVTGLPKLPSRK